MADKKIIREFLFNVKDDIRREQKAKGITASGESAKSLRVNDLEENDFFASGALYGADYFKQQRDGQGPAKRGSENITMQETIDWIIDKGITPRDNISKKSLAFLIYRKINRDGTDIFLKRRQGIDMNAIFERNIKTLTQRISNKKSIDYRSRIFLFLKEELEQ